MTTYTSGLHRARPRNRNRRVVSKTSQSSERRRELVTSVTRVAGWVLGLAVLGGAAVGVYYGWHAAVGSERLRVRRVELIGNEHVKVDELAAYTGIQVGSNLLDLDLDAIALQLRHHPWIESARVRRRLPDEVVIEITEHKPAILVSLGDVYLADASGILFKRFAAPDGVELPILTGLSRDDVARHPDETTAHIYDAIALANSFAERAKTAWRLDELRFDANLGWSVLASPLGDETADVRFFLGSDPAARLSAALTAATRVREAGERPSIVFSDGKKSPNRVQVKLGGTQEATERTFIATAR